MNRTQRAVKKSCKQARDYVKHRKNEALAEMRDSTSFYNGHNEELAEAVKEEKGLKSWHRKCVADHSSRNKTPEVSLA